MEVSVWKRTICHATCIQFFCLARWVCCTWCMYHPANLLLHNKWSHALAQLLLLVCAGTAAWDMGDWGAMHHTARGSARNFPPSSPHNLSPEAPSVPPPPPTHPPDDNPLCLTYIVCPLVRVLPIHHMMAGAPMGEERWSVWVEDRTSSSLGVTSENQRASDGHESHHKIGALGYVMQGPVFPCSYKKAIAHSFNHKRNYSAAPLQTGWSWRFFSEPRHSRWAGVRLLEFSSILYVTLYEMNILIQYK